MHGRVKVRTTVEQEERKKKEKAAKVAQYKADIAIVFQKRKSKIWDNELLLITKRILLTNPDIYTLWNIRREAFENNKWSEEDYKQLLENEMSLTESCLRENPKSYSVWYQRYWVMEQMLEPDWEKELSLCAKCLNLDERNFHCWDYRKFIVQKTEISNEEELEFSERMITKNSSNYSSWHYRSLILSKMFSTPSKEIPIIDEMYRKEFELVMNAFLDPNDTSARFYHRWLLESFKCVMTCKLWRAYINKDTATIVIDDNISKKPVPISLFINNKVVDVEWQLYPDEKFAKLQIAKFVSSLENLNHDKVFIKLQETMYQLLYSNFENAWIYKDNLNLPEQNSNDEQLSQQLELCNQLSEMGPNNKCDLLTGILLMKKINFEKFYTEILNDLTALSKVDCLRKNYYKDLRSKFVVEYKLFEIWKEESNLEIQSRIDLSGLDLTKLHNNHYFSFFKEINLDANQLGNSLHQLSTLQRCTKLSLSSNNLISLKRFPILNNLEDLSLKNNKLVSTEEIFNLIKQHENLKRLDLRDNLVCDEIDVTKIQDISLHLEIYLK